MSYDPESDYYDAGGIETIEILKAKLPQEQFIGFCVGNALKYLSRMNHKHETVERDLEKAGNYIKLALARLQPTTSPDEMVRKHCGGR